MRRFGVELIFVFAGSALVNVLRAETGAAWIVWLAIYGALYWGGARMLDREIAEARTAPKGQR